MYTFIGVVELIRCTYYVVSVRLHIVYMLAPARLALR